MEIGMLVSLNGENCDTGAAMRRVADAGIHTCQLTCWDISLHTRKIADKIAADAAAAGVRITALWAGWSGPKEWNFYYGPSTLGLVPAAYREKRLGELMSASDFALMLGVTDIITHVGFIPENPHDPDFIGTVGALRQLTRHMENRGQYFLFETGQETPVAMLRAIEEIGQKNLGVNLDTGNLILYGKANPVDALDVIGRYVRNTHIKDGFYPVNSKELGAEAAFGEGKVDFPPLIRKLAALGYDGPLTIEREISGQKQLDDIIRARDGLNDILAGLK